MRRWGIMAFAVAACSKFEGAPTTDAGAPTEYEPAGEIACDESAPCHAPSFCCVSSASSRCETSGCLGGEEARVRCSDGTACAQGFVCCMRIENFNVGSIACEPTCASSGETRALQLCSDRDSNRVCPGACVGITTLLGGKSVPDLDLRACE
jgi:hypothetical protein